LKAKTRQCLPECNNNKGKRTGKIRKEILLTQTTNVLALIIDNFAVSTICFLLVVNMLKPTTFAKAQWSIISPTSLAISMHKFLGE
jgi:hypothetical protein